MTIKEKELHPVFRRLAHACPAVSEEYYNKLMEKDKWVLEAWDLVIGLKDLESCVHILRKALNKQRGIEEPPDADSVFSPELKAYYMQLD